MQRFLENLLTFNLILYISRRLKRDQVILKAKRVTDNTSRSVELGVTLPLKDKLR